MPRNPKKKGAKKEAKPALQIGGHSDGGAMDVAGPSGAPAVWRPGVDAVAEDEELDYDPTSYDCLHKFSLEWPCLSFDIVRDDLGGPRSTFPHTVFLVAGTQAANPRHNYLAVLRLASLGQGRHGKRRKGNASDDEDDSSDGFSSDGDEEEEGEEEVGEGEERDEAAMEEADAAGAVRRGGGGGGADRMDASDDEDDREAPARMHFRLLPQNCSTNRLRLMPQRPGVVAMWGDNGSVRLMDATQQLADLALEQQPKGKAAARVQVNPLQTHQHADEGYALDWSPVKEGRLASGDCKKHIHVWEPGEGGRWQVSNPYAGHTASVEDIQWSPMEATVFASCSVDRTIRVFDTRERARAMMTAADAHASDVNVLSWNRLVTHMLASGGDDGSLRIWDLRFFGGDAACVSHFAYHRSHISSVEWSPYESSMLATCAGDHQLAVWDLALERDPEEEAALGAETNAMVPEDLPPQLLFQHAGLSDPKELHWHAQIPGMLVCTGASGFDVFRPSNL